MTSVTITRAEFLEDRQGRTFTDVLNDPEQPFDATLDFFNDAGRQRRMEESEIHHDRAPMAGVVRELESLRAINHFLSTQQARRNLRLRQAIGVLVRMIMERRGWRKTGKKGSLGVRSAATPGTPRHNTGGLAFWFIRAERYECEKLVPFPTVRQRCQEMESVVPGKRSAAKRPSSNGRTAKRSRTSRRASPDAQAT